jgi:hypothetical protein
VNALVHLLASTFLPLLLILPTRATAAELVYAWADVSITTTGAPDQVKVVVPVLSPEMAAPIENAIAQWHFSPGLIAGAPAPRTTSVLVAIRLVTDLGGESRIEAEKLDEGPRVLRRSPDPCLGTIAKAGTTLTFTVNEEGRAVDISATNSEGKSEACAIKVLADTIFKPETVNGQAVSRRITRQIRFR